MGAEESRVVARWIKNRKYTDRNIHNIMYNAGVFPNDIEHIDYFCEEYADAISQLDAALTWGCVGESCILRKYADNKLVFLSNDVNKILFNGSPWTTALKGRDVLIVHPFVETMARQYEKRDHLFSRPTLPEFNSISFVKAVNTAAGEHEFVEYSCWKEALESMKEKIRKKNFDVALIGAGAYGLPLAAYVKSIGKKAIHMASDLQILFGIRGRRWDMRTDWVLKFNDYWTYPMESETPKGKKIVEGGSYWK